ncbi:MAG: DUF92 domain-containing protein, partial [Chloroflexota bacterium]|nr:DUF92 domain-containing protein [Chloroflexota bacterium]
SRLPRKVTGAALEQAKGARRDAAQVLANGGASTVWLASGSAGGFLCGLAAASADTWATEVGTRAGQQPRLVTSGRPVQPGASGGVTVAGLLASATGALAVGAAWAIFAGPRGRTVALAALAGMSGSLLDSLLGATVQAVYRCPHCGRLTEASKHASCGVRATLVRGHALVTNDVVNGLATTAAAALGGWLGV